MASSLLPAWLLDGSSPAPAGLQLRRWDDGFSPSGCGGRACRLLRLPRPSQPRALRVVDGAVSARTADLLFSSAARATVWGVYVPTDTLSLPGSAPATDRDQELENENESESEDVESYRRRLARRAVQEFLVAKATPDVVSSRDWEKTHGVAVWVIASSAGDETEYHLDYAEQVRFEANVLVPPVYGATLHVSRLHNAADAPDCAPQVGGGCVDQVEDDGVMELDGGGFHVNTDGLDHYEAYGYKTRKKGKVTTDELELRGEQEPGWRRVAYKFRRGIVCDGEFPHFSGRVRSLPDCTVTAADAQGGELPMKRVVVGFNLFPHEIGPFVQKYPEHSSAFNKYVKLSQTAVKQTRLLSSDATWSLESVRKNPKQAAFIKLLAKKIKEKQRADAELQEKQRADAELLALGPAAS